MHSTFAPIPTSTMRLDGPMDWPLPPAAHGDPWDSEALNLPVRIETKRGYQVDGEMLGFDPQTMSLIFRFDEQGGALRVQFQRFRKLTILQPLADTDSGRQMKVQFASQLRKFKIALSGDSKLSGRTAGHVENRAGLFLYVPNEDECDLERVFVPAGAYTHCVLGPSVEEDAALRWIGSPQALSSALDEGQGKRRFIAIGEAIYDLGVISARQLATTLANQSQDKKMPVGEMLVAEGLLSRADLRTALGHKIGYPLVNLANFPLSSVALGKLPLDVAFECNALPLMLRGTSLIVAVDNLACVAQLTTAAALQSIKVVPVLARQKHIESALLRAYHEFGGQAWSAPQQGWKLTAPMAA